MTKPIEAVKSAIVDRGRVPVLILDMLAKDNTLRISYHNDAFLRFLGRLGDDFRGEQLASFFDDKSVDEIQRIAVSRSVTNQDEVLRNVFVNVGHTDSFVDISVSVHQTGGAQNRRYVALTVLAEGHYESTDNSPPTQAHHLKEFGVQCSSQVDLQRVTDALDAYPDPFVIYDSSLKLVIWNKAYALSMTDSLSELRVGMHLRDVLSIAVGNGRFPDASGREDAWIDEIASEGAFGREIQDLELKGDIHHRLLRYRAQNGDIVVIRLNSTELVRQRRTAEEAQSRLIAALNSYPEPFVIYDSDDRIIVWNDAYRVSMSGPSEPIEKGMHRTEVARIAIRAGKLVGAIGREEEWMSDEHQAKAVAIPVQDLELDGDIHHRLLRSRAENGDLVIVRLDTTELVRQRRSLERHAEDLERANSEISFLAEHDDLTGLGNRRLLKRKLKEIDRERRLWGGEIAVLHIDLDRFKLINDTMGHAAGDQALLDVSDRIRKRTNSGEVVARVGGDEFVVLMHVTQDVHRPDALAKQLLIDLARPSQFEGKECRLGASIGLATTPVTNVDDLLSNSDLALYRAKNTGRSRLAVFDQSDLELARRQRILADDILRAIETKEFVPYFQPQIDSESGRVVGLEALARWNHPVRGILAPDAFLPVAADLDAVAEIDKMIFEKAIKDCSEIFADFETHPDLSFNVSSARVKDNDPSELLKHLNSYPGQVSIELLETIFLEEEDDAFLVKLDQYREMGLSIEVDDFGSGRASLVALQRIGPDRLKIDRRLVEPIAYEDGSLQLLKSIVDIGHALRIAVTAEGVETKRQVQLLTEAGCDRLQGFYFSKPLPAQQLRAYFSTRTGQRRMHG